MKTFACAAIALTLSGCAATYTAPQGATATLVIHAENDSRDTNARVFWASAPADESCRNTKRLATTLAAGSDYTSEPVAIAANDRFLASASYTDARFGANGMCNGMLAFMPETGHKYQLELAVRNNMSECQVGLYDTTSGDKTQAPFELPATACRDSQQVKNGQAMWKTYTIVHMPAVH